MSVHLDDFLPLHAIDPVVNNGLEEAHIGPTMATLEADPAKSAWLATSKLAHELAPIIKRLQDEDIRGLEFERFKRSKADDQSPELLLADNLLQAALETCIECNSIEGKVK